MTNSNRYQTEILQDRYGLRVAAHLSRSADALPHVVTERLKAARMQALAKRKVSRQAPARLLFLSGSALALGSGEERLGWWGRIASVLPLVVLVSGLIAINKLQDEHTASELASVDAALLVDDLPLSAYADPGFVRFIQTGSREAP